MSTHHTPPTHHHPGINQRKVTRGRQGEGGKGRGFNWDPNCLKGGGTRGNSIWAGWAQSFTPTWGPNWEGTNDHHHHPPTPTNAITHQSNTNKGVQICNSPKQGQLPVWEVPPGSPKLQGAGDNGNKLNETCLQVCVWVPPTN